MEVRSLQGSYITETCTKEVAEETDRTGWILDTEDRQTAGTANILLTVGRKKQGGQGGLQGLGLQQLDGGGTIFQKEEGIRRQFTDRH